MSSLRASTGPSIDAAGDSPDSSILLVEGDPSVGCELVEQLRADRFQIVLARTAEHARALARGHPLRAVVLGNLEPSRGALDLLEEIRCEDRTSPRSVWDGRLPAVVLGSSAGQLELLRAFDAGADDFIAPPVSYLELRARLRALLRRAEGHADKRVLSVGSLEIDTDAHTVRVSGTAVELCRLEYELLVHLAREPTSVCSKRELLYAIWNRRNDDGARTLDSHASRLRRKLDAAGAGGFVVNVWGVGYRLI
ncbi:MAG TPA: response regulator transcription factor [Solirubrobacteraceae bacterium]|nr:response regulator transcription factor [Solirubrobacteraceae bacterium]